MTKEEAIEMYKGKGHVLGTCRIVYNNDEEHKPLWADDIWVVFDNWDIAKTWIDSCYEAAKCLFEEVGTKFTYDNVGRQDKIRAGFSVQSSSIGALGYEYFELVAI